jgi:hypothetical protein
VNGEYLLSINGIVAKAGGTGTATPAQEWFSVLIISERLVDLSISYILHVLSIELYITAEAVLNLVIEHRDFCPRHIKKISCHILKSGRAPVLSYHYSKYAYVF